MSKFFHFIYIVILVVGCGNLAECQDMKQVRKIMLSVDLEKEKELQLDVDKGHQPWRLIPIDVAFAALQASVDKGIPYDKCNLVSETGNEAIVKCKDKKIYIVHLQRIVRPKGIWTATEVEIE